MGDVIRIGAPGENVTLVDADQATQKRSVCWPRTEEQNPTLRSIYGATHYSAALFCALLMSKQDGIEYVYCETGCNGMIRGEAPFGIEFFSFLATPVCGKPEEVPSSAEPSA